MRKVIVSEFLTVDGVMEAPDQWSFEFWNNEQEQHKFDELFASVALLLGHVTYEGFAAAWPGRSDAEMLADIRHEGGAAEPDDMAGFADRMNSIPKYVVSTTLETAEWNSSTIISDNVAEEVTRLKQLPGQDILVAGSAELVHTLAQHDLVDEYRLMIYPILVGQGKLLFSDAVDMTTLRLVDSKVFSTGVVVLTYAPARDAS